VLSWRGIAVLSVLVLAAGGQGHAQSSLPTLSLSVPPDLHAGEHANATLDLALAANLAMPLLVTPFREGEAIEVVRGRLLRADGRVLDNGVLRFDLPLWTHVPGSAVLGVRLLAYVCEQRCKQVELQTRINVVVLPERAPR
jgi:hypothetical protein